MIDEARSIPPINRMGGIVYAVYIQAILAVEDLTIA